MDTIFGKNTCKISRYIPSYRTLTSEVIWGHGRSKSNFLFFHRNANFSILLCLCLLTLLIPLGPSMKLIYLLNRGLELYSSYRTLTSEVIWGRWRSNSKFFFFHQNVNFSILLYFFSNDPFDVYGTVNETYIFTK